jgi:hypothetical protein
MRRASNGVAGATSDADQVLGDGDKIALGGGFSWGPPATGATAGETMPAGAKWLREDTATSQFAGVVSSDGRRWGFYASGAGVATRRFAPGASGANTASGAVSVAFTNAATTIRMQVPTSGSPLAQQVFTTPFYIAVGVGTSAYEVMRVTKACNVAATIDLCDFTVERSQYGTPAVTGTTGHGWTTVTIDEPNTLFGPARVRFWTDQPAFAHDGVVGGAGTLTVPGVTALLNFTVTWAGGIQTAITAGSGNSAFGGVGEVQHGRLANDPGAGVNHSGATYISRNSENGLVTAVTTIP